MSELTLWIFVVGPTHSAIVKKLAIVPSKVVLHGNYAHKILNKCLRKYILNYKTKVENLLKHEQLSESWKA